MFSDAFKLSLATVIDKRVNNNVFGKLNKRKKSFHLKKNKTDHLLPDENSVIFFAVPDGIQCAPEITCPPVLKTAILFSGATPYMPFVFIGVILIQQCLQGLGIINLFGPIRKE
jgi:hypothetical protein